jgi:DNA-binding MarR family transcriptional regulator
MPLDLATQQALEIWRGAIVESVRRDAPDLSARQIAILLTVYQTPPPHTVRGLAAALNISKPAVTRALDTLSRLELVRRKKDDSDLRSILVQRTVKGSVYLSEFADLISAAAKQVHIGEYS